MGITQSENVAGGDIVGGNKTVTTQIVVSPKFAIDQLNARFKEEFGKEPVLAAFVAELQHYWDKTTNPDVRGLAEKLKDSDRADLVRDAEALKEKATKKIVKYQTSASAQRIIVWALADMYGRFMLKVKPAIEAGRTRPEIDQLIHDDVVEPVLNGLGENVLSFYKDEVIGLMFFLAGNCHIQWNQNADLPSRV